MSEQEKIYQAYGNCIFNMQNWINVMSRGDKLTRKEEIERLNEALDYFRRAHKQFRKQIETSSIMNITNIKYTVNGMLFDAAVDWDWNIHCYELFTEKKENALPIELFNCDIPEWDIRIVYQNGRSDVDFDNIIKQTKEWIKEMTK